MSGTEEFENIRTYQLKNEEKAKKQEEELTKILITENTTQEGLNTMWNYFKNTILVTAKNFC